MRCFWNSAQKKLNFNQSLQNSKCSAFLHMDRELCSWKSLTLICNTELSKVLSNKRKNSSWQQCSNTVKTEKYLIHQNSSISSNFWSNGLKFCMTRHLICTNNSLRQFWLYFSLKSTFVMQRLLQFFMHQSLDVKLTYECTILKF